VQVGLPATGVASQLQLDTKDAATLDRETESDAPVQNFPVPAGEQSGFLFVTGGGHLDEALRKFIFAMPQHQVCSIACSVQCSIHVELWKSIVVVTISVEV
jgi:hypothetical protein